MRPRKSRIPRADVVNDASALNGGSARHWYVPGAEERRPPPLLVAKTAVAVGVWAVLALGALALASFL